MLEKLTRENFEPHLNTIFRLPRENADPLELELVEITGGDAAADGRSYGFTLTFRGGLHFVLSQHIFTLEHDRLGPLEIFLVPVAREADGFRYEAVFNRAA